MVLKSATETNSPGQADEPITVINVLSHGPGYRLLSEQRQFLQAWDSSSGEKVGIVNREWPGDLGHWVLNGSHRLRWEVWQPDVRADQVYSHRFDDGVVHRLFPAHERVFRPGLLRPVPGVESDNLERALNEQRGAKLILHGLESPWWAELLPRLAQEHPTVLVAHGTARRLVDRLRAARHPLTPPALIIDYARSRQRYTALAAITAPNQTTISAIRAVYRGPVHRLTMGCDFEFWMPPDPTARAAIREKLGIQPHVKVLITAAFLRPIKQVDRLIEACIALGERNDYRLLIVGQGDEAYRDQLTRLGSTLIRTKRLLFEPYVTGDALRRLYWAADAFVCSSRAEGASVAVMEAMACGLPVISTPVGGTYELMQRTGSGATLPAGAFARWRAVLEQALAQLPPATDRQAARAEYDWRNVATRFTAILDQAAFRHAQAPRR